MTHIATVPAFVWATTSFRGVQLRNGTTLGTAENWAILAMAVSASAAMLCVAIGVALAGRRPENIQFERNADRYSKAGNISAELSTTGSSLELPAQNDFTGSNRRRQA